MPGIFGVLYLNNKSHDNCSMSKIERLLKHHKWYGCFTRKYKNLNLGAVSTSPYFSEENNFYEDEDILVLVEGNGITLNNNQVFNANMPIAKHIGLTYKKSRKDFISRISGSFNLVIFDKARGCMDIWNDQFGFSYLYYYQDEDVLIFGPEMKVFMAYTKFDKTLNEVAIASYFISNVVTGNQTFFEKVKLLPSAGNLSIINNEISIHSYWRPVCKSNSSKKSDDYVREGADLYRASLIKKVPEDKNRRIIMPLSGGLDSRLLLKILSADHENIDIYTHGDNKCLDYRIAKKVAGKLGLTEKHKLIRIEPAWMGSRNAIKTVWFNECNVDYRSTYLNEVAEKLSPGTDTFVNGIIGAHMSMGSDKVFSDSEIREISDKKTIECNLKRVLDIPDKSDRLKDMLYDNVADDFLSCCVENLFKEFENYSYNNLFCDQKDMFIQFNLGRRMMGNVNLNKFYFNDVLPFVDVDLFALYREIPPNLKINHQLYQQMFKQVFPDMAGIAWASTGVSLFSERKRVVRQYISRLISNGRYYVKRFSLGHIDPPDHRSYLNRERWLRNDRVFREMIINMYMFAKQNTIPYIDAEKLDNLMKMHDAGRDYIFNSIIKVYSFIVWYRLFILEEYTSLLDLEM